MKKITIIDVGPRDGLQNEPEILSPETKADLIKRLVAAGVPRIEVGSFVNPNYVPQMAGTDAVCQAIPDISNPSYTALIPNMRGYDRAIAVGLGHVRLVLAASEGLHRANFRRSIDESLADFAQIAARTRVDEIAFGVAIGASFGDPFDGQVPPAQVVRLAVRLTELGADEIMLADTTGMAVPTQVQAVCEQVIAAVAGVSPQTRVGVHLHNTRNTGYANAYAALQAGITHFDTSVGGIGGCPFAPRAVGNVATEDLVHMLNGMGFETGIDLPALLDASTWLSEQMQKTLPALVGKAEPVFAKRHSGAW